MNLSITIDDQVSPALEKLGRDMPRVMDYILQGVSGDYIEHVTSRYLSGQVLKRVTGELIRAYRYKKLRKNVYKVYPGTLNYVSVFETGAVIRPKRKKLLRFYIGGRPVFAREVFIRPRPFVSRSASDYVSSGKGLKKANAIIGAEIVRRGLG